VQQPLHVIWLAPVFLLLVVAQDAAAVLGTVAVLGTPAMEGPWLERHCPVEAIVVMGAAQYDGRPSPVLERRLDGALDLYRRGCGPLVMVTGGRRDGDRFSEGEAGAAYLRSRGLPADALLVEDTSRTSVEALRNVERALGAAPLAVVTDDLHARRTAVIARRLGLTAVVAPVRARSGRAGYALREIGALLAYRLGVFR
jgi:uncharacterized SAM-binding protein YcdF (DUF218 family)